MSLPIPSTFLTTADTQSISCIGYTYRNNVSGARTIVWTDCNLQPQSLSVPGFGTGNLCASNTPSAPNAGVGFSGTSAGSCGSYRNFNVSWDGNPGEDVVYAWYDKNGSYCEGKLFGTTPPGVSSSVCSLDKPWKVSGSVSRNFVVGSPGFFC
jgi:hypothetical protein